MEKPPSIFAAGVLVGFMATGVSFTWQEWNWLDLAWADPQVTVAEA